MSRQEEVLTPQAGWLSAFSAAFYQFRRWPVIPVFILAVLIFAAVTAPLLAPHHPVRADLRAKNTPPIWLSGGTTDHLLGTDNQGRDILSRLMHGQECL